MAKRNDRPPFFVSPDDPPARRRILVEGLRLFTEKGICETTVRDIAAATGFTNPALYRHFESKEALASFLIERCYGRLAHAVGQALDDARPGPESMRAFVEAMLSFYAESPPAVLFISDNIRRFWPHLPRELREFTVGDTVRQILLQGRVEKTNDDLDARVATIVGAFQQVYRMLYLELMDGPPERWVDPLTATFVSLMPTDSGNTARAK
jgi:AcrR family transcriptional regulator